MVGSSQEKRKKKRITEQQITEMKQLYREGLTISAIAEKLKIHRQTAGAYVVEKHQDLIGDEVRKTLLGEALRNHFNELAAFVREDVRKRFDASAPGAEHTTGKISTAGLLALPYPGSTPHYVTAEWNRMYNPSPREQHLLQSLRQHILYSRLWVHWDRWRKKVVSFENASQAFWARLGRKLEDEPPADVRDFETVRSWAFGNLIRMAGGREPEGIETLTQIAEPGEFSPAVYSSPSDLSRLAAKILEEAKSWPELDALKSAMAELAGSDSQSELRHLAGQIDFELAGVELMGGFGGSCHICPTR